MQRQKTIAKWLAVLLLLTLAVASYVALSAILDGRGAQDNIAGALDGDIEDEQPPSEPDIDDEGDPVPPAHIPVYSDLPRSYSRVDGASVLNIGGEADDLVLDYISCYGKDVLIFSTSSVEYDVMQSGLHLAVTDGGELISTLFIAKDEEYVDSTLSAGGLLIVTRGAANTILRLVDKNFKVTLKNTLPLYDGYSLFTNGGVLKLYAADSKGVTVYTVSSTLSAAKSNRVAQLPDARFVCIMPSGTSDLLFLETVNGISIYTYSTNDGFISQNELLNCSFVQILPIKTSGRQTYVLLTSNDVGYTLFGLETNGKQFESASLPSAKTAAIVRSDSNIEVLTDSSIYTYCSHLELSGVSPLQAGLEDDSKLYSTASGRLYAIGEDGLTLLSREGNSLGLSRAFIGAVSPILVDFGDSLLIAYSSDAEQFENLHFGMQDVYFVIDINN